MLPQQRFQAVQSQVCQDRGDYSSDNVAKLLREFSLRIPRSQLRPGYGEGFRGAPVGQPAPSRRAFSAPAEGSDPPNGPVRGNGHGQDRQRGQCGEGTKAKSDEKE
jgi:hypothetical protein